MQGDCIDRTLDGKLFLETFPFQHIFDPDFLDERLRLETDLLLKVQKLPCVSAAWSYSASNGPLRESPILLLVILLRALQDALSLPRLEWHPARGSPYFLLPALESFQGFLDNNGCIDLSQICYAIPQTNTGLQELISRREEASACAAIARQVHGFGLWHLFVEEKLGISEMPCSYKKVVQQVALATRNFDTSRQWIIDDLRSLRDNFLSERVYDLEGDSRIWSSELCLSAAALGSLRDAVVFDTLEALPQLVKNLRNALLDCVCKTARFVVHSLLSSTRETLLGIASIIGSPAQLAECMEWVESHLNLLLQLRPNHANNSDADYHRLLEFADCIVYCISYIRNEDVDKGNGQSNVHDQGNSHFDFGDGSCHFDESDPRISIGEDMKGENPATFVALQGKVPKKLEAFDLKGFLERLDQRARGIQGFPEFRGGTEKRSLKNAWNEVIEYVVAMLHHMVETGRASSLERAHEDLMIGLRGYGFGADDFINARVVSTLFNTWRRLQRYNNPSKNVGGIIASAVTRKECTQLNDGHDPGKRTWGFMRTTKRT